MQNETTQNYVRLKTNENINLLQFHKFNFTTFKNLL